MLTSAEILEIRGQQPRSLALNASLDVHALKASICKVMNVPECLELVKIAEGGFHRIYVARLSTGGEVIARVAFDIADFAGSGKMDSEVATIQWLTTNTDLPVPKVLYYCADPKNPVGSPYMIVEKIPGRPLRRMWETMSEAQKDAVVVQWAKITATLLKTTKFDQIGSIYSNGGIFSLGPMIPTCNPWCFRKDLTLDRGPWSSEQEYLLACASREIAWISNHQDELAAKWNKDGMPGPDKEELAKGYIFLLQKLQAKARVIQGLDATYEDLGPFVLRHPDYGPENIMVREDDPTIITGIIDWECANTAPLWAVAQIPGFLRDKGDEWEDDPVARSSKARLREIFSSTCSEALPGIYNVVHKLGEKLCAFEEAIQVISTMSELKAAEKDAAQFLIEN